jgi:tRNA(Ile)-lysidine synthase
VVPLVKKINPDIENTIKQTSEKVTAAEKIFEDYIERLKKEVLSSEDKIHFFNLEKFRKEAQSVPVLFELLKDYGFNYSVTKEIFFSLESTPGKRFESPAFILVKDRNQLVITLKDLSEFMSLSIDESISEISASDLKIRFKTLSAENFKISSSKNVACLDLHKLKFPLQLRKWKEGDWFCPLGMNKKKKLSDFLIDQKVPLNLKDQVYVLTSNGSIVWIVNYRIDERFKVTGETKKILSVMSSPQ